MPTLKFTKAALDKLTPPVRGEVLWFDTGFRVRGGRLGVRITAGGARSWIVQGGRFPAVAGDGRLVYRARRRTLGDCSLFTLAQAHEQARKAIAAMLGGEDPWEQKRTQDAAALRRGPTMREVLGRFMEAKAKNRRPATVTKYRELLGRYCVEWLDRPLVDFTAADAEALHTSIQARVAAQRRTYQSLGHASANGTLRAVRALWNYAAHFDLVPERNPVRALSKSRGWYPDAVREISIPVEELPRFYAAVVQPGADTVHSDMVLLMLFTGMRCGETRRLRWEHVDFANRVIRLPAELTKSRRKLDLPLSDHLVDLLRGRLAGCGGESLVTRYLFPGRTRDGHADEPKALLRRVALQAKLRAYYSPHVLRHTFITLAELEFGIPTVVVRRLTNHVLRGDVHAGYIDHHPEKLRPFMQRITDGLKRLCGVGPRCIAAATTEVA